MQALFFDLPRNNGRNRHGSGMDWKQFFAALTASLAWPGAILAIVFILKKPIASILPKIRSFKYGELQIDLEEKLKEVETTLATEAVKHEAPPPPPAPSKYAQLAVEAPRASILLSWMEVEKAVRDYLEESGIQFAPKYKGQLRLQLRMLKEAGRIDDLTYDTFVKLWKVRGDAAHLHDKQIDFEEAVSMSSSCAWLVKRFEALSREPMLPGNGHGQP